MTSAAHAGDEDALNLADKTTIVTEQASEWKAFVEGAFGGATLQGESAQQRGERLSFDVRGDKSFAPGWSAVLADRVDFDRAESVAGATPSSTATIGSSNKNINTLKEAYVSWQIRPDLIADLGRINIRSGVGFGYNPTDVFRAGALRSIVSIDPASLRENRQGSDMLRGQALWGSGSFTTLYSPKLANQPSSAGFSLNTGATNAHDRWQMALSQKLLGEFAPQFLLSGGTGQSPQTGINATTLIGNSTVAFVEYAGGRAPSLRAQALQLPADNAFRTRLASGLTYTTASNVSLTFEYEYNGAAPNQAGWNALRAGSPRVYGAYRNYVSNAVDLPTRQALFAYASWSDAFIKRLDLTALVRYDALDSSRLHWFEARYHWARSELALQWQRNIGAPFSDYGAIPQRTIWEVVGRYYF